MTYKNFWISLAFIGFLLLMLVLLQVILFPFIAGLAIAYFLDPLCDRLEAVGLKRGVATAVITAGFFTLLAITVAVIVPPIYSELLELLRALPHYWESLQNRLHDLRASPLFGQAIALWEERGGGDIVSYSEGLFAFAVRKLQNFGSGVGVLFNLLSLWLITPVIAFYLLRDWDKLMAYLDDLTPKRYRKGTRQLASDIDKALSGYVRGQFWVCMILGLFLGIALWLVGLPYGFIIGFMSGLLSFIPYLGQLVGAFIGLTVAYASTATFALPLWVLGVFVIGNIMEGFFLTPRLVGKSIGLHAVWVLFALLAGATLFGFLGILLALPMAAVLSVLVRFAIAKYRQGDFYKK